jgi:HK97 family phage portal protein
VLPPGFKFKPLQFNSVDAQFQQLREFQVEEIARAFRVPPTIIQHLAKATQSNVENLSLEFVKFGLLFWIRLWEGELRRIAGVPVTLDLNDLLRADMESRADAYAKLSAAGLTLNELRAMEGRPPKPGGDALLRPLNYAPADAPPTDGLANQSAPRVERAGSPPSISG